MGFYSFITRVNNKQKRITKSKCIKIYKRNKSLDFFTQDRIKLLLLIKSIKKKKNTIQINSTGIVVSKIYGVLKKYLFHV